MASIFISYRRDGADAMAQLMHDKLVKRHYTVFYDIENLSSDRFDKRIYSEIEQCTDFLLILPKGGLDRCIDNENDWIRREIKHALLHKKNIIPLMLHGFEFPNNLPDDIKVISNYHGLNFGSMNLIDAKIDQLCTFFKSEPQSFAYTIRKIIRNIRKTTLDLFSPVSWLCGILWRITITRYVAFSLVFFCILSISIDIKREFNGANVDQWINPRCLLDQNTYMMNIAYSEDNSKLAVYNGDGNVYLHQIKGDPNYDVIETSFGAEKVSVSFSRDNTECMIANDNKIEIYTIKTKEKTADITLNAPNASYFLDWIFYDENTDTCIVTWGDTKYTSYICCTYSSNSSTPTATFDISGYSYVFQTDDLKYILFSDNKGSFKLLDTETFRFIDSKNDTEEFWKTLKKCVGNVCNNGYLEQIMDKNERYFITASQDPSTGLTYYQICDMENGILLPEKTTSFPIFFSFYDSDSYLLLEKRNNTAQLYRINFVDPTVREEVILTEKELLSLLHLNSWENDLFFHKITNSNTLLVTHHGRFYLIDFEQKECIASSNNIVDNVTNIYYCNIFENNNSIYTVFCFNDDFKSSADSFYITAFDFSFKNNNGKITVYEDAYSFYENLKNMLTEASILVGASAVLIIGYINTKNKKAAKARTHHDTSNEA